MNKNFMRFLFAIGLVMGSGIPVRAYDSWGKVPEYDWVKITIPLPDAQHPTTFWYPREEGPTCYNYCPSKGPVTLYGRKELPPPPGLQFYKTFEMKDSGYQITFKDSPSSHFLHKKYVADIVKDSQVVLTDFPISVQWPPYLGLGLNYDNIIVQRPAVEKPAEGLAGKQGRTPQGSAAKAGEAAAPQAAEGEAELKTALQTLFTEKVEQAYVNYCVSTVACRDPKDAKDRRKLIKPKNAQERDGLIAKWRKKTAAAVQDYVTKQRQDDFLADKSVTRDEVLAYYFCQGLAASGATATAGAGNVASRQLNTLAQNSGAAAAAGGEAAKEAAAVETAPPAGNAQQCQYYASRAKSARSLMLPINNGSAGFSSGSVPSLTFNRKIGEDSGQPASGGKKDKDKPVFEGNEVAGLKGAAYVGGLAWLAGVSAMGPLGAFALAGYGFGWLMSKGS